MADFTEADRGADEMITFNDVAQRLGSGNASLHVRMPYENRHFVEGTTIGFSYYVEWFEVNVHDAHNLSPEEAERLLRASPTTPLENCDPDEDGNPRWFGGDWVQGHHVRVWWNPRAF